MKGGDVVQRGVALVALCVAALTVVVGADPAEAAPILAGDVDTYTFDCPTTAPASGWVACSGSQPDGAARIAMKTGFPWRMQVMWSGDGLGWTGGADSGTASQVAYVCVVRKKLSDGTWYGASSGAHFLGGYHVLDYGGGTVPFSSSGTSGPDIYERVGYWYYKPMGWDSCAGVGSLPSPPGTREIPPGGFGSPDPEAFEDLACELGTDTVKPSTLMGLAFVESSYGVHLGPSSAGAVGPYQFLPSTWRVQGRDHDTGVGATSWGGGPGDPYRIDDSMHAARDYVQILYESNGSSINQALLRYNGASMPNGYDIRVLSEGESYADLDETCLGEPEEGGGAGDYDWAECVPSGWQVLNPLAYVWGMGCVLGLAFVPSGTVIADEWDSLGVTAENSWGWGPLHWVGELIGSFVSGMSNPEGDQTSFAGLGLTNGCFFGANTPLGPDAYGMIGLDLCDSEENGLSWLAELTWWLTSAAAIWGAAMGMRALVAFALGQGDGSGKSEGDE